MKTTDLTSVKKIRLDELSSLCNKKEELAQRSTEVAQSDEEESYINFSLFWRL
jgi:hypothetical protein